MITNKATPGYSEIQKDKNACRLNFTPLEWWWQKIIHKNKVKQNIKFNIIQCHQVTIINKLMDKIRANQTTPIYKPNQSNILSLSLSLLFLVPTKYKSMSCVKKCNAKMTTGVLCYVQENSRIRAVARHRETDQLTIIIILYQCIIGKLKPK